MTTKRRTVKPASEPKVEIRKAPDFKSIYVNWAQGTASPYDVLLNLGESAPDGSGGIEVELKARVVFSPLEAKMVALILAKTLREHESQFGTIVIPRNVALHLQELLPPKGEKEEKQTEGD